MDLSPPPHARSSRFPSPPPPHAPGMGAAWPSSAFVALEGEFIVYDLTDKPGKKWASIDCSCKKAYGCGEIGHRIVEGLSLYVRRFNHLDLSSSLSLCLTDNALRSIEAEFDASGAWVDARCSVQIAQEQFLVVLVVLCDMKRKRKKRKHKEEEEEDYDICSFDMRIKSPRWYGRVQSYCYDTRPVILPYNFLYKVLLAVRKALLNSKAGGKGIDNGVLDLDFF